MRKRIGRPSAPMIVAVIALVLALGGSASALIITSAQIADGTIQGRDIGLDQVGKADVDNQAFGSREAYNNALGGVDIKDNDLTGTDINDSTLGSGGLVAPTGALVVGRNASSRSVGTGVYCIAVAGVNDPRARPISLTMDLQNDGTSAVLNQQAFAEWDSNGGTCQPAEYEVHTFLQLTTGDVIASPQGFAFQLL